MNHAKVDYGMSKAVVCFDYLCDLPVSAEDFLRGQRFISAAQVAREGKNVKVLQHDRENIEKSYKSILIDATGKLPSFARAMLPQFVILMEQRVDFPSNQSSVVCLKPKSLRGMNCFAETLFSDFGKVLADDQRSLEIPSSLALPHSSIKVDPWAGWTEESYIKRPQHMQDVESKKNVCTLHKRLILDVGTDNFVMRRIRKCFLDSYIRIISDQVRETCSAIYRWKLGLMDEPNFDACCLGKVASPMKVWPKNGQKFSAPEFDELEDAEFNHDNNKARPDGEEHTGKISISTTSSDASTPSPSVAEVDDCEEEEEFIPTTFERKPSTTRLRFFTADDEGNLVV